MELQDVMNKFYTARDNKKIWWNTDGCGDEFEIWITSKNEIAIGLSLEIEEEEEYYDWSGKNINEVVEKMNEFIDNIDGLRLQILLEQERKSKEEKEHQKEIDEWLARQ